MSVLSKVDCIIVQRCFRLSTLTAINSSNALVRSKHTGKEFEQLQLNTNGKNQIHLSANQQYPATESLTLPSNIEDIASNEKSRFSPLRNRDISGSFISSMSSANIEAKSQKTAQVSDDRVASYDCTGAVSLSSAMQTNVPDPFQSKGKSTHLNMPGGQWMQNEKYMSEELNNSHHVNTRANKSVGVGSSLPGTKKSSRNNYLLFSNQNFETGLTGLLKSNGFPDLRSFYSTEKLDQQVKAAEKPTAEPNEASPTESAKISRKAKFVATIKEYGAVVVVFHVGISLISLGCCYLAITSGIDLDGIIKSWGSSESAAVAATAAPFVVAYAVHKSMAPIRLSITVVSAPIIVKYLRRVGLMKGPKPN